MAEQRGYSMRQYGEMITAEPRMSVYAEALRRAVTPGCTVIEIGSGFGVFAILACRYGAGRVIAIEPDPSVELIMPMARDNGCADRITVVRGLSTAYVPEEKADVLISDLRGGIPLFQDHVATIVDARARLLKPGGHQLPQADTIRVALARAPKAYARAQQPWLSNRFDLDLSRGRPFVVNEPMRSALGPRAMLSEPQTLAVLDYRTITEPDLDSTVELVADRPATAHGLQMWFDAQIADGLTFSNAPGESPLVYGRTFLPFEQPVRLRPGDRVAARIRARLFGGQYVLFWNSTVIDGASGTVRQSFVQTELKSRVLSPRALAPCAADHVPQASTALALDRDCLALVDDRRSLAEIAQALMARHPGHFSSESEALGHVGRVVRRYAAGAGEG
ncbi:MAG: class I SAM-dependent methyltransferase [Porphyrobacter sp.]|jgi:protein arginine N-methyltransferase 1|nr:class I SAM-dependent methyltransferase [Porphyrobacter sp.]